MTKYLITFLLTIFLSSANAQSDSITFKDYAHAGSFLSYYTQRYIDHGSVKATWLPGDRFWYRDLNSTGSEFILVNAAHGKPTPAFDQPKLAASFAAASCGHYTASMLPFKNVRVSY